MKVFTGKSHRRIVMPNGGVLISLNRPATNTEPNLPPSTTTRWVPRRKAQVVAALLAGTLSVVEACRRYSLSAAELLEWERHYKAGDLTTPRKSAQRRALH
jgi:transposase-like protein